MIWTGSKLRAFAAPRAFVLSSIVGIAVLESLLWQINGRSGEVIWVIALAIAAGVLATAIVSMTIRILGRPLAQAAILAIAFIPYSVHIYSKLGLPDSGGIAVIAGIASFFMMRDEVSPDPLQSSPPSASHSAEPFTAPNKDAHESNPAPIGLVQAKQAMATALAEFEEAEAAVVEADLALADLERADRKLGQGSRRHGSGDGHARSASPSRPRSEMRTPELAIEGKGGLAAKASEELSNSY